MGRTYFKRQVGRWADGEDVSIGDVRYPDETTKVKAEWFEQEEFLSGDYCGNGTVARSNVRVLLRDFPDLKGLSYWLVYGSHGSMWVRFDIGILSAEEDTPEAELRDMLDKLADYMLIDEDDHSALEHDDYAEAWENHGAGDFADSLAAAYPHHDRDFFNAVPKAALLGAWEALNPSGEYVIHETGGAYFPFDSRFGDRAGMCKTSYAKVRDALLVAIKTYKEHNET